MKKSFTRVFALVLCLCIFGALVACGSGSDTPPATTDPGNAANTPDPGISNGDETVYKFIFSHNEADDVSTHDVVADAIVEYLNEKAPGRFDCEVYTAGALGADRENIESVQEGTITMTGQSTPVQVTFVPSAAVFDAPFAYRTIEDAQALLEDKEFIASMDAEYEAAGFKQGCWVVAGYRHLTTNKEIKEISDLKGLKVRTMENTYHMALWKALGVTATPLASSEIYTALQQGTVDGQENDYGVIVMKDIHSVQKFVTETHHLVAFNSYILNLDWYNNLPQELQKVFDEALEYARQKGDEFSLKSQGDFKQTILDSGVTINYFTPEQIGEMKDTCADVYDLIKNSDGMNLDTYNAFNAALERIYAG